MGARIRTLGQVRVTVDGSDLALTGRLPRRILLRLLLGEGGPVTADSLMEAAWGSPTSMDTLRVQISRLRRALAPAGIQIKSVRRGWQLDCGTATDLGVHFPVAVNEAPPPAYREAAKDWKARGIEAKKVMAYRHAFEVLKRSPSFEDIARRRATLTEQIAENSERLWRSWVQLTPARLTPAQRKDVADYIAVFQLMTAPDAAGVHASVRQRAKLSPMGTRRTPMLADVADTGWETTIALPSGLSVARLPPDIELVTPAGRYTARYRAENGTIHAWRNLVIGREVIQPELYPALDRLIQAPVVDARAIIVLTPSAP